MPFVSHRFQNLFSSFIFLCTVLACLTAAHGQPSPTPTPSQSPSPAASPTPDPAIAKVDAVKAALSEAAGIITAADELRLDARSRAVSLDEKCRLPTATEQTMNEFEEVTSLTIDVNRRKLLASIADAEAKITAADTKLKAARDALPTAEPLQSEVKRAKADADTRVGELEQQRKALVAGKAELTAALQRAFTCAQGMVSSMSEKIAPLKALAADAKGDAVLAVLNRSISDLSQIITYKQRVSTLWGAKQSTGGLIRALSALGKTDAELKTVTDGLTTVDADVKGIGEKLKTWLASVSAYAKSKRSKLGDVLQQVIVDPALFSGQGLSEVKAGTRATAELSQLSAVFGLLELQLSDILSAADLQIVSDAGSDLKDETRRLGVSVALLQDGIGGSFEDFDADQVSLYYFTDVRRLMEALNSSTFEMGGQADARERAAQARRDLAESELALAESQGQVNTHQRRLEELKEEQRQAHAQFLSADGLLTTASRKLEELKARPDKDDRKITLAEQRKSDLQTERDAAKERDDQLTNEQTGLPAKIREAQSNLTNAQESVRTNRANIIRLAIAESEAFARARDNTPFLVAMPIGASHDPVKRVMMFAFNDSKTIFLRGNPADLDKVREIIAQFDRPAPQARMTLWSLELNSTADKDGSRSFNKALQTIEDELANTRARIATSLSFLRDCINEEVNRVALLKLQELHKQRIADGVLDPRTPQDAVDLQWARLHFYQREVLFRLGFDVEEFEPRKTLGVARFTLPDPASTTTLGEALMVLNLAKPDSRWAIANNFKNNLKARIDALGLTDTLTIKQQKNNPDPHNLQEPSRRFAFMRRALSFDLDPIAPYVISPSPPAILDNRFAFNSKQQEIVRAIKADAVAKVLQRFRSLLNELKQLQTEAALVVTTTDADKIELKRQNLVNEILPLVSWVRNEIGMRLNLNLRPAITRAAGQNAIAAKRQTLTVLSRDVEAMEAATEIARELNPSRKATARVAAADQMLKEMIIAVEDDLDRHFIQPMMLRLRDGLVQQYKGIGVGIIQRTSVLASNRTLARVDARGSAQLALGEETDIIEGVQQLANLYLAGQTGNVLSILGGINALPRKNNAELYGLTTGGVFKVTPIFDPSGQALRFQFDHVSATMVREPDGTTSPQLPRIERHTINTEVQLSNMELREVSRFNANARLGLPKRTWGGLPIFNSIPWIRRNLPLIGWFVKKEGDAPFVQQSLIFGQTTMYPTIGDLMDLLRSDAPPVNQ